LDQKRYALGFLKGRAEGFRRGLLTIANVEGGAKMAARYGATDGEIAGLLSEYGLAWHGSEARVTPANDGAGLS
jgi:hypothetical protein